MKTFAGTFFVFWFSSVASDRQKSLFIVLLFVDCLTNFPYQVRARTVLFPADLPFTFMHIKPSSVSVSMFINCFQMSFSALLYSYRFKCF